MSSGRTKIPEDLYAPILDLAGSLHPETRSRWTGAQIAAWLAAEHGIEVSQRTVSNLLRSLRHEFAQGLQDDARAALLGKLTAQTEAFDELLDGLLDDMASTPKLKLSDRAEVVEVYRRALDTKLRWAGIGEKVTVDANVNVDAAVTVTDARAELAASIAKLAQEPERQGSGEAPRDPEPRGG
jgi:hypothetical protein